MQMNCLLVVAVNLIYTQNFSVRPQTFGTTLVCAGVLTVLVVNAILVHLAV